MLYCDFTCDFISIISTMKIAIIGAGPTGLISEKYALEQGFECDVYEQTGTVGGTWIYTDRVGNDENGLPIHSSMYQGLRTNLPKETMTILNFPFPEQTKSYITQPEVVDYFNSFADQYNLRKHIKYNKCVTKISPLPEEKWNVIAQDSKTKVEESHDYDAIFVCNGHYRDAIIPEIPGQNLFQGTQLHSHTYRNPEPFRNKTVLVIGAGPSGQDIAMLVSKVAKHVFLSHKGETLNIAVPTNVIEKPVVQRFEENGAIFVDSTKEEFDAILYCTGYKYSYPFLTEECGIKVENNWVHPLYKHIINVQHPTMFFIGIPFLVCVIPMFDIQARFALAALRGKFILPSKEIMLKKLEEFMRVRKDQGIPQRYAHKLGGSKNQKEYFQDLAETAGIKNIPNVVTKLYALVKIRKNRDDCYKIIDDENFIQLEC